MVRRRICRACNCRRSHSPPPTARLSTSAAYPDALSCSLRDHYAELTSLSASVFGLSAQATDYQKEARDRLHLPFELLSDSGYRLKRLLRLPTFNVTDMELYKRLALIVENGRIRKVFYPVFPPDQNAADVVAWLRQNAQLGAAGDAPKAARS